MAKAKISVSIDESVLERVDRLSRGTRSRSEIVESALQRWLVEGRRRQLEEEITAYYRDRDEQQRAEDEEWAGVSARQLEKSWKTWAGGAEGVAERRNGGLTPTARPDGL
ncbi:MAG: CopG family ribbon-helix-helix protein [Acidobacteriota bacterium]